MVYHRITYHCDRCHKSFTRPEDAQGCQIDHIVTDAVDGFSAKLDEIFSAQKFAATVKKDATHDR